MGNVSTWESLGYIGIFISVFIECGVPLGLVLPLPGYTLLFSSGVLASSGKLEVWIVFLIGLLAAILGYVAGYFSGIKYGRKLFFEAQHSKYFTRAQGERAEKFMKRYGYISLIFGRFIAFVHNLMPILGGIAKTPFANFMAANIVGAILWVSSGVFIGYFFGQKLPNAEYYLIALVVIFAIYINSKPGKARMKKFVDKIDDL